MKFSHLISHTAIAWKISAPLFLAMLYNILSVFVWYVVMSKPPVKPPSNQEELPLKYVYGVGLLGLVFALIFMSFFYFSTH